MRPQAMRGVALAAIASVTGLLLTGCGEKSQVQTAVRKGDAAASKGAAAAFTAPGWKPGDAVSWEQQIKARAQAQNEYLRTGAR